MWPWSRRPGTARWPGLPCVRRRAAVPERRTWSGTCCRRASRVRALNHRQQYCDRAIHEVGRHGCGGAGRGLAARATRVRESTSPLSRCREQIERNRPRDRDQRNWQEPPAESWSPPVSYRNGGHEQVREHHDADELQPRHEAHSKRRCPGKITVPRHRRQEPPRRDRQSGKQQDKATINPTVRMARWIEMDRDDTG
jgi:hypothetical protein